MYHHGPPGNGRSSPSLMTEQVTIELSEDPTWYRETIAFAKQHVEEKPHIPHDQQRLVFNAPTKDVDGDDVEMFINSNWWDDSNLLVPHEPYHGKDANLLNLEERLMPVPQENDEDLFLSNDDINFIQQPATKRQKIDHEPSPPAPQMDRNQILNLLITEQKKQGEEISQLKEMVRNLTLQIEARIANNQLAAYQQHQQQLYQQYQNQMQLQQPPQIHKQPAQVSKKPEAKRMAPPRR
jgi:hypothetical protein